MKALIIDDSRAIRMLLGRVLAEYGFDLVEASNGAEGLDCLRRHEIQLALVDWSMPLMSGIEFVEAVRRDPTLDGLVLVMVTSRTEQGEVVRALEAGADEYIMKPFTREMIHEKLALLGITKP